MMDTSKPQSTTPESAAQDQACDRREFLARSLPGSLIVIGYLTGCEAAGKTETAGERAGAAAGAAGESAAETPAKAEAPAAETTEAAYDPSAHKYAMGIDTDLCIGCGRCADSCKTENDVPREPFYFRTWIERYVVHRDGEVTVTSPNGGITGFPPIEEADILRTFFVPKLCNQCQNPPCVQVCPVGATYTTEDGVTLVDSEYCIGCRYCIQACPYGARFLHPVTHTAEKCTFCYHRLVKGLQPACVENCPTQARVFGELEARSSPMERFQRMNKIQVLKPHLNTDPKVLYANLDGEVS